MAKRVGDFVAEGDPLVEVTTDKVDVEVPATASGVVTRILPREGQTVAVGSLLAEIDASKTDGATAASATPPNGIAAPQPPAQIAPPSCGDGLADAPARRIARQLGVDLKLVRGSGPNGLILRSDVLTQAQTRRPPAITGRCRTDSANAKFTPLKGPAAALSGYMEQSLSIPTATSFRSVPVDVLDARRKELNGGVKAAGRSERISFTHVIAYALVRAAHELPASPIRFGETNPARRRGLSPESISDLPSTPSAKMERVRWSCR